MSNSICLAQFMHSSRTYFREKLNIGKQRNTAPTTITQTNDENDENRRIFTHAKALPLYYYIKLFSLFVSELFCSILYVCFVFFFGCFGKFVCISSESVGWTGVFAGILMCLDWLTKWNEEQPVMWSERGIKEKKYVAVVVYTLSFIIRIETDWNFMTRKQRKR